MWTRQGTVSVSNNSKKVYGAGTPWVSNGKTRPGDEFIAPNGARHEVESVQSNTELTLVEPYMGAIASGQSYALLHIGLLPAELAVAISELQSKYLTTISQLWAWETSVAATVPLTDPATGVTSQVKTIAQMIADLSAKQQSSQILSGLSSGTTRLGSDNLVVNGDFRVDQLNNGAAVVAIDGQQNYCLDRWWVTPVGGNATVQRTTGVGGHKHGMTIVGGDGVSSIEVCHRVAAMDCCDLSAGKLVTVSFTIYQNAGSAMTGAMLRLFGANAPDDWSSSTQQGSSVTLQSMPNNATTDVSATFDLGPDAHNGLWIVLDTNKPQTNVQGVTLSAVRVVEGAVPSTSAPRPYAAELALCRWTKRIYATAQNVADLAHEMRTTPVASGSGPYIYSAEL
jgi:hypothetical protein